MEAPRTPSEFSHGLGRTCAFKALFLNGRSWRLCRIPLRPVSGAQIALVDVPEGMFCQCYRTRQECHKNNRRRALIGCSRVWRWLALPAFQRGASFGRGAGTAQPPRPCWRLRRNRKIFVRRNQPHFLPGDTGWLGLSGRRDEIENHKVAGKIGVMTMAALPPNPVTPPSRWLWRRFHSLHVDEGKENREPARRSVVERMYFSADRSPFGDALRHGVQLIAAIPERPLDGGTPP